MPYQSKKQQRWAHSPAGKEALTDEEIDEFDHSTNYDTLPEEAQAGKGPIVEPLLRRTVRAFG